MAINRTKELDEIEEDLEGLNAAAESDAFDFYYEHADVDLAAHEKRWRAALLEAGVARVCEAVAAGDYAASVKRRARIISSWAERERANNDENIALKDEIQQIVLATKPVLDGEEIPRHRKTDILLKEDDREARRAAFLSEGALREKLRPLGRRLYRGRNDAARALGYDDFPSLMLAGEDLTVEELRAIFDRYEQETRTSYDELLAAAKRRLGIDEVKPWDLPYIVEKLCSAPARYFPAADGIRTLAEVVRGFGQDLDALGIPIYADADIPYGGLCFGIRIPDDIRILLNLKDGMPYYGVLYHEFGHAVHRKFTAATSFALKAGDAGFFAEAMADTWGMLVSRPAWLGTYTAMTAEEISQVARASEWAFAARVRRFIAVQLFELAAYADADGDLDAKLSDYEEKLLGFRYEEAGRWAEVYFPFLYPVYSKNYMLARVIQRAVHRHLDASFGEILTQPRAFEFLVEHFYADGAGPTWKEKLAAVGAEL